MRLCVKAPVGVYLTKLLKVNMKNVEQLAKEHLITELCTNGKSAIIYVATVGYLERFAEPTDKPLHDISTLKDKP